MDEAGPGDSGTPPRSPGPSDRNKPTAAPPVVFSVRDGALPGRQHGRAPVLRAPEGLPLREVRRYHPHGRPAGRGARGELLELRDLRGDGGRRRPVAFGDARESDCAVRFTGAPWSACATRCWSSSLAARYVRVCPGSWRGGGGGGKSDHVYYLVSLWKKASLVPF